MKTIRIGTHYLNPAHITLVELKQVPTRSAEGVQQVQAAAVRVAGYPDEIRTTNPKAIEALRAYLDTNLELSVDA